MLGNETNENKSTEVGGSSGKLRVLVASGPLRFVQTTMVCYCILLYFTVSHRQIFVWMMLPIIATLPPKQRPARCKTHRP